LNDSQKAMLLAESRTSARLAGELLAGWRAGVDAALAQLAGTSEVSLTDARSVGRAHLPSTVLGLLFHAAEHASRHTGKVMTTAKIVRG
jgi:hypothetical protein